RAASAVRPTLLLPPCHGPGTPGQYIDRSTMMLSVAVMEHDTSVAPSPGSESTGIVVRLLPGSVRVSVRASPAGVRYWIVALTSNVFGLLINTNVSKYSPVLPSARNQLRAPDDTAADPWPPS